MKTKVISPKTWLEIAYKDLDNIHEGIQENLKARRRREFILVIACLMALLYVYPVENFEVNPQIEIPAVSFKIPIKDAAVIFPTVLTTIYLIFVASIITHMRLSSREISIRKQLSEYIKSGSIPGRYSPPFRF